MSAFEGVPHVYPLAGAAHDLTVGPDGVCRCWCVPTHSRACPACGGSMCGCNACRDNDEPGWEVVTALTPGDTAVVIHFLEPGAPGRPAGDEATPGGWGEAGGPAG